MPVSSEGFEQKSVFVRSDRNPTPDLFKGDIFVRRGIGVGHPTGFEVVCGRNGLNGDVVRGGGVERACAFFWVDQVGWKSGGWRGM